MSLSKNVGWHVKQQLSDGLGILWTEDLGNYMRVPILHKKVNNHTYQFILEKVNQILSNWKAKNLSIAGRDTLSVFQALLSYVMQTVSLPKAICDKVDKICRDFIWGDTETHKKIHLIAWNSICRPKKDGVWG